MRYLSSGSFDGYFGSLYLLCSVFIDTDCNKCGQTSRLATGAHIQTSCNCEKDIHSYTFFFPVYLLIITLNNYSYNTTEKTKKTKQNTLTIDINRVKQD